MNPFVDEMKQRVLQGGTLTLDEINSLAEAPDREALYEAAGELTRHFGKPAFNPCSIINARAGKCTENCKWCAQSGHYHTHADVHGIVSTEQVLAQARYDEGKGVKRFCQVTSGRAVKGEALKKICDNYRALRHHTGLFLCGSLGLLDKEALQQLWEAGMRRYHCNLETAPSYFGEVCTTHTLDEKIQTLKWAREVGFELCSGGIIGMGESRAQRIELAMKLREVQLKALQIGINAAVVGDLLTTVGSKIDEDRQLAAEAGYRQPGQ